MSLQDPVLHDVLQEHLEELDYLWECRESSIYRWDFRPLHLGRLEARMEAHLDGLREGGGFGIDLAKAEIEGDTWSLVAAAAWALLARPEPILGAIADTVAKADIQASLGIRHALRHSNPALWRETAEREIQAASDLPAAIWADASAFHRLEISPVIVKRLCGSGDAILRRVAYSVRFRSGPPPSSTELRLGVEDPDEVVREWILRSAARWGSTDILPEARLAAARGEERDAQAVHALGAWGGNSELPLLRDSISKGPVSAAALRGIGALGDARGVPLLLEAMHEPALSEAAGEAFTSLTGEPIGLVEVPLGGERVFVPDPKEAAIFWERHRNRFRESVRYRWGREIDEMTLATVLSEVDLEGARDAYLRSCLASKGNAPDLELERFAVNRGTELSR